MTAAELNDIVHDVPRAAWPELEFENGRWVDGHTEAYTRVALVEQAFIGSMTAWLASHNWVPSSHVWRDGARVELSNGVMHRASSLVAALAAACKEAETDAAGALEDK